MIWVLLMVVFSRPYEIATVDILGTYFDKRICVKDQKRALTITVPRKTSFGCVRINGGRELKK